MSEFCHFRCGRRSTGNIGMMRYCFECMARLTGWDVTDARLRHRCAIRLTEDGEERGWSEWVPDVARHERSTLEIRL